ncbi:acetoacetate decarboxylase family protein [Methylobacterium sp. P31]
MAAEPQTALTRFDGVSYPPAPWDLRGTAYLSLWQVRTSRLPQVYMSRDVRPMTVLGRVLVAVAFAVYEPDGVLAYDELLLAVQVRGIPLSVNVPCIWVDHPASLAGARALWSVPKQEAAFEIQKNGGANGTDFEARAMTRQGDTLAHLRFWSRTMVPGRWPVRMRIVQHRMDNGGERVHQVTEAQAWARVSLGAATWVFPRSGPLSFLRGRSPLTSIRLSDMSLRIGSS